MQKKTFYILLITSFSIMLGISIISPFMPVFAKKHGANGFWLGMIFAGFGISRGLIMPFVGGLSDRFGRKIFVLAGLLLYAILSVFYPVAKGIGGLAVLRLVHGLAMGLIMPIVMAYVGDFSSAGKEAVTVSFVNMMFYLGLAFGPLLGGIIDQYFGFSAVFHTIAVLGLCNFFLVLFFLPDAHTSPDEEHKKKIGFASLIKQGFVKAVLIIAVLTTLLLAVFISFIPSLADRVNINTAHIGFLIFTSIALAGILQVPSGKLADMFQIRGKLLQIAFGISLAMVSLLIMPFCPNFHALLFTGIFLGIGSALAVPPLSGLSVFIGKEAGMGSWMGIINAIRSLAFVITPIFFGITMDFLGIRAVFYLLALLLFFGGLLAYHYVHLSKESQ